MEVLASVLFVYVYLLSCVYLEDAHQGMGARIGYKRCDMWHWFKLRSGVLVQNSVNNLLKCRLQCGDDANQD